MPILILSFHVAVPNNPAITWCQYSVGGGADYPFDLAKDSPKTHLGETTNVIYEVRFICLHRTIFIFYPVNIFG